MLNTWVYQMGLDLLRGAVIASRRMALEDNLPAADVASDLDLRAAVGNYEVRGERGGVQLTATITLTLAAFVEATPAQAAQLREECT